MIKRGCDFLFSLIGMIFLLPVFMIIALAIKLDSSGSVFYTQIRVGKMNRDFRLWKFRTMHVNADHQGLLTIGTKDSRVSKIGYYLRKFKLDELPQLFNVFIGDMSLVGPRPEVRKFVNLYDKYQLQVLDVRPGITDYASIMFINENELLQNQEKPETYYIEQIMPQKLALNTEYIKNRSYTKDIKVIFKTILEILR